MARVLLIYNPVAARTKEPAVGRIQRVFDRAGWSVETVATGAPGDAADLARQGVEHGVDVVGVYGGDGTTIQAVDGLGDSGIPVGLIPGGTGNLLAANLGISRNPIRAAQAITTGTQRRIDLGRLTSGDTARQFAVACGAGFDAEIMARTSGSAKSRWGMAAYVTKAIKLLREFEAASHCISIDGRTMEVPAVTVLVANCGMIIPPFVRLKPDIALDDGQLDVVALNAGSIFQAITVFWPLVMGRSGREPGVWYGRGRSIRIESDRPRQAQLDGEPAGTTPFTAEISPNGMQVMVPRIA